ncbi:bifunctional aminoglycoside phosphotransferase/ATP-binding protein [Mycolicibacterium baixiangningiae]|uniref:bifunctional aminoglycoside phosphotransferase/ATP-binding protein n=1 Tax=Mycolicibacterium baixiangningiae TaxID=2761578 RepID=UPI0018D04203|nr:AAA family ATPase [Mycolicibacterium baixiangningiae]
MTAVRGGPVAGTLDIMASVRVDPLIHETHTGVVILVGDRAYKAKKPIITDFLDFSTVEGRERACSREVELNRRMAPDSYLGVAHFNGPDGPPEPVIVMRRYPETQRLSTMVKAGEPVERHLEAVAIQLARFHEHADRSHRIDADARVPTLAARWQDNIAELRRHSPAILAPDVVSDVERLAMQYLSGRAVLFSSRITDRRIVDGHGDLLADDIFCTADGPVILDCLEFDDQLRHVDGIDDGAFLAMDLEFLGRADLGRRFLDDYRALAHDTAPTSLAHFCIAYRAIVRAKTDCIRVSQGRPEAAADARRHLDIALAHLRTGTVQLIIVGGGPGTGKTTLARALAEPLGAQVISTDDVRQELNEAGEIGGRVGAYNEGLYSPDNIAAVYDAVLRRASLALNGGRSVILDGTWRDTGQRERARTMAGQVHCPVVELACTVALEDAEARISRRVGSASQATPEIAAAIHDERPRWQGAHPLDTSRPLDESVAEAQQICCLAI